MLCLPSCLLPALITRPLSRLFLHLSPSHTHLSVFYLFHSSSLPLCPCVLNWSTETNSLKYLLWNLLCDDNSRHFPCRTGKTVNAIYQRGRGEKQAIKVFLQPLKCKLLSLMGSPLCLWHSSEYL